MKRIGLLLMAVLLLSHVAESHDSPLAEAASTAPTEAKILVAFFSCTGNTRTLAGYAADALGADLYEMIPETAYTAADLNYNDRTSRATAEQNDDSARPTISGGVENMDAYDIIFLGYPIWWGQAPRIVYTFMESYDFAGKTIVPFCTSGGSGVGSSATNLKGLCAESAVWLDGTRLDSGASKSDIETWINGLGLELGENEVNDVANITLSVDGAVLTATMLDNPSARDFLNRLPLTLTLEDYNNTEKISGLPGELSAENAPPGYDPSVGDICYYAPWGNLCIFYQDFGYSNGLIPLAHIDSGIETLANMNGEFVATIDRL